MSRPVAAYKLNSPDEPDLSSINLCTYAHPGKGKTVLSGTGDIILDGDGTMGAAAAAQGSKAIVVPATTYDEIREAFEWVAEDVAPKKPDAWVSWDSLTLFQDRTLVDDITAEAAERNPRQDPHVPGQREYGIDHHRIKMWVRRFVKLKVNFHITCHVMADENPDGDLIYMPAVQGKGMSSAVTGYCNVVGYYAPVMDPDNPEKVKARKMLFRESTEFYAKDQFECLGPVMNNPTLPKIRAAIQEANDARRSSTAAVKRRPSGTARRRKSASK